MPDIGLFQRVHAAGNRLNQNTLLLRKALGQNMLQAGFGQLDILGKTAVGIFFEAEHSAALAHPVFAGAAEMAVAAGHDLLGADIITDGNAGDLALDVHDLAVEFMAGDAGRLHVAVRLGGAPDADAAVECLQVAGADAAGLDLQQDLTVLQFRKREIFIPVVAGCVSNNSLHCLFHKSKPPENQPFRPDVAMPSTRYFWNTMKIVTAGIMDRVDMANIAP